MLVNRHLQKVLFTADEAHCASHPSRARAERTRPNPSKTPPLGPPLLSSSPLLSSPLVGELLGLYSARTGDKCAQSGWHHCGVTGGLKESSGSVLPHLSSCTVRDVPLQTDCGGQTGSLSLSDTHTHTHTHTHTLTPIYHMLLWLVAQAVTQHLRGLIL